MKKIETEKNPYKYLSLLVSNYKKGDYKLLLEIANRSDNKNFLHLIGFNFRDIFNENNTTECKEPLEIIYKKMNCGLCRTDVVKILLKNNVLSETIKHELQYDSHKNVRKLYKLIKNG